MPANHLANEKSPYLLQHAHNPVDWYPWGPEAFEKARRENRPIFLSVGYSTCHWCHVMERESFENEKIAEILNRHFVSIKVDREERPDVDRIYMTFVQATTGGGGWPMSVFLTPDLKPFFGGTYFPPDNRYGRAGFGSVLERIAQAWSSDRDQIADSAADVVRQLEEQVKVSSGSVAGLDAAVLDSGFYVFRRSFDSRYAGFGEAPKFPRPAVFNFLLRYWARTGNREALDMTLQTLREMARGGMHDQLGGGFHRYSVDARWFVPHFEKMLYDQAQLAISYLEAFQISGDMEFAEIARLTLDYVLRDMTDPEGGFYSAEDADSVIDPGYPAIKGEGAFYVWTQAEIENILGDPVARWFSYRYGVEPGGNVTEDPHQEFTGKNILYEAHDIRQTADHFNVAHQEVQTAILQARRKLLGAREKRVRPHRDDKVLTGWNGLMISAFAKAGAILSEPRYLDAARKAAGFISERMYERREGVLLRRYRAGDAGIPGFLDDYAFFIQALLDLYEADFDIGNLRLGIGLAEKQLEIFEDRGHGAFFNTTADDPTLVMRMKEDYDGAEPSGNSIAALNFLRLGQITGRNAFREAAARTLGAFASRMSSVPAAVPQMLAAYDFSIAKPKQIILVGEKEAPDTRNMLRVLHARFLPNRILLQVDGGESRRVLGGWVPAIKGMSEIDGRTTAYVCEDFACRLPTADPEKLAELLQ